MTDLDFRLGLRWPRVRRSDLVPALMLAAGCMVFFPLAAVETMLTTGESGYAENPSIYAAIILAALLIAALISFVVILRGDLRLTEDREARGFVACTGLGILYCALLLATDSAGTWPPYLLHWDGLSVNDRVEGSELEVKWIVLLQAFLAGTASVFVGSISGFLAWVYQFAPRFRK